MVLKSERMRLPLFLKPRKDSPFNESAPCALCWQVQLMSAGVSAYVLAASKCSPRQTFSRFSQSFECIVTLRRGRNRMHVCATQCYDNSRLKSLFIASIITLTSLYLSSFDHSQWTPRSCSPTPAAPSSRARSATGSPPPRWWASASWGPAFASS